MIKENKLTIETAQGAVIVQIKLGGKTETVYHLPQAMSGEQFAKFKEKHADQIRNFIQATKDGHVYNGKTLVEGSLYGYKGKTRSGARCHVD